jgi:hypothetical protein
MEDIVAVRVKYESNVTRYFLTWGRVFGPVDGSQIEQLVREYAENPSKGEHVNTAEVCRSMQEASHAEYFFEAFSAMLAIGPKFGDAYESWSETRRQRMGEGKEIWDLGSVGRH